MKTRLLLILAFVFSINIASAQLELAEIFTDNMVLQRDQPINIWGWAKKGQKISVQLGSNTKSAKTNSQGRWMVVLPSMTAEGPFTLAVYSGKESISLKNILIGDVWLCSGQSNMEWPVIASNNADEEIAGADDELIRHYKIPLTYDRRPQERLDSSAWVINSPENTGNFTAVGYYFAKNLRKNSDVPIGLLNSTWGGSRIEAWMHANTLSDQLKGGVDAFMDSLELKQKEAAEQMKTKVGELLDSLGMVASYAAEFDDSGWMTLNAPQIWEEQDLDGLDGIAVYRKEFNLTKEEADQGVDLSLGMIDDSDWTYVNGVLIGNMIAQWNVDRVYKAAPEHLKEGKNTIVVKVEDFGGGGGFHGEANKLFYKSSEGKKSLAGDWKFKVSQVAAVGSAPNQIPTLLYNKMIHPILDFRIKGVIWYQGESNGSNMEDANAYGDLFSTMISDWRERWGQGDFPFLWVQLANWLFPDEQPVDHPWAVVREAQTKTLELENTGQAIIIDIGEAADIHPRNKQDVGYRLSLAARKVAFGEDLVYSGPVYKSHSANGKSVSIEFDHIGSGLLVKDKYGYVKGFALAGSDGVFKWAKGRLEGNKVVVWSDDVPEPVHIRYAWGINPDDVNLYNNEGLPAGPFRTD